MKKPTLLIIVLLITIASCNKIDTTKEVFNIIGPVEVTPYDPEYAKSVVQKIYIEEFTGHTCTYCPAGARELKAIMEDDATIIATAIHCTNLANPAKPPFDINYKTPMGDRICEDFKISGLPKATINRVAINANEWGVDRAKWRSTVESIARDNIRAGIQLQCKADTVKQEIEAFVAVSILKKLPNPVQLCLVLQQDNNISGQLDGGVYIMEYVHNHTLLTGFNGNYGTKLTPNGMVNEHVKYSATFKLSYENSFLYSNIPVIINNCSVVAYLLDEVTKEVVQVESFEFHR